MYGGVEFKHIHAVGFSDKLRREVEARKIKPITVFHVACSAVQTIGHLF